MTTTTMHATYVIERPKGLGDDAPMDEWSIRLVHDGRELIVPYFTGLGLRTKGRRKPAHLRYHRDGDPRNYEPGKPKTPTIGDVLSCLVLDAEVGDQSSFHDFCADLGYDEDSRKAHATWETCVEQHHALRRLFGRDYEALMAIERDELEQVEGDSLTIGEA